MSLLKKYGVNSPAELDDDKKKAAQGQQAPIPAVEVAKIRTQADLQIAQQKIQSDQQLAQMRTQSDQQRLQIETSSDMQMAQMDTDRDTVYQQTMLNRDQTNAQIRLEELKLKRELALLDYANKHNITLEQIKAKLAGDAMKLRVQRELSLGGRAAAQVATPVVEPPGRARDGHSFEE
jgi:hypothetical protein